MQNLGRVSNTSVLQTWYVSMCVCVCVCVCLQLNPAYAGKTCGLCGNYNGNQGDDFLTVGGLVETRVEGFGNAWKMNADCDNIQLQPSDPCILNPKRGIHTHTLIQMHVYEQIFKIRGTTCQSLRILHSKTLINGGYRPVKMHIYKL